MGDTDQASVLLAASELLGREVALEAILKALIERIGAEMGADRGTLYLVDHAKDEVFSRIAHLPEQQEIRLRLGQGVAGHVAREGTIVNVPTTTQDPRFFRGVDERTGYRTESILAAPMRDRQDRVIGVVQLLNKRGGAFNTADEATIIRLATQAAQVIEATTLYEDLVGPPGDASVPLEGRFNRIVGESPLMQEAYRLITKAAVSEATVLIRGESGTGKERFSRAVHVNSPRRDGPFVKVDCAALPASLIENELFGHERGAYTGADQKATGKLDAAHGGTLFLDELGELPMTVQGKLLRVLQDREFERVGGTKTVKVDVRIVAATNRDLQSLVDEGAFRSDLYYRVKVVEILLPPLRVRGDEDVSRLARHFVATAAKRHRREAPRISPAAMARLCAYPWPGNVRELENCLESAVVIMDGDVLLPEHLPLPERSRANTPPRPPTLHEAPGAALPTLAEVEKQHVLRVLDSVAGNQSEAARVLGIGRNTLRRKLEAWGRL